MEVGKSRRSRFEPRGHVIEGPGIAERVLVDGPRQRFNEGLDHFLLRRLGYRARARPAISAGVGLGQKPLSTGA